MLKNNLFIADWFPPFMNWWMETHANAYVNHMWDKIIPYSFQLPENSNNKELVEKYNLSRVNFTLSLDSINNPDILLNIISKESPDFIFFNSLFWIKVIEQIKIFNWNIKLILRSWWNDISQSNIENANTLEKRREFVVNTINNNIDLLITNSEFTKKMFLNYWIKEDKMKVIIGWVDLKTFFPVSNTDKMKIREKLNIPKDKIIWLSVSRLVDFKNIDAILEIAKNVVKKENNIFIIVWWWPLYDKVINFINNNKLDNKVFVIWNVVQQNIAKYYQMADYFLQMSTYKSVSVKSSKRWWESYIHTETMGRSVMEAMACWLPVIATNVWWVPKVVKNWGILIPDNNISEAVNSILKINWDEKLKQELIDKAKNIVSSYSWDILFNNYGF